MQMLRIQPSPSASAPCCSPSSSSPSAPRQAGSLHLHSRAADSRSGFAAPALSLRIDLVPDAPRRRQSCRWCSGASSLSCCKATLGGGSNEQLPDWRQAKDDDGFLQASLLLSGEFAIERLIGTLRDDKDEGSHDQFKFINNLVEALGYEVKMVRITKRVINTYYARIFLGKPAERATLSVDSRPSDAINVATRCQAPIYVSKDIVLKDAIKIVYGTWRGNGVKTVYDVSLDSATEGPDLLAEELGLIGKMNTAVIEERYEDAAIWRDKLSKLRVNRLDL